MPKLTLQFEGRHLREYPVGVGLTIGRSPDNTLIIDNPAVSGHHARVFQESGAFIVEDLNSTNGTFVNGQLTKRRVLRSGDVLLIGKHQLVFENTQEWAAPQPELPSLGDTVYLDTKQHRALLSSLAEARQSQPRPAPKASAPRRMGVLQVIAGAAEQAEYDLDAHTTLIGKSPDATVRLRGWFKPAVAVAIARGADGYIVTPMGGRTRINNEPLESRQALQDGDVLNVHGLLLEFRWKEVVANEPAA